MLALSVIALANVARGEMRISDTYVAHGPNLATMLQVTQTDNGQITGVYSFVEVSADGRLDSEHISVTGVIDGGQLTLTLHRGLLETTNFAGNLKETPFSFNKSDRRAMCCHGSSCVARLRNSKRTRIR